MDMENDKSQTVQEIENEVKLYQMQTVKKFEKLNINHVAFMKNETRIQLLKELLKMEHQDTTEVPAKIEFRETTFTYTTRDKLDETLRHIQDVRQEITEDNNFLKDEIPRQVKLINTLKAQFRQEHETAALRKDEIISKLKDEMDHQKVQNKISVNAMTNVIKENEILQEKIEQQEQEMAALKNQNQRQEQQISSLRHTKQRQKQEISSLRHINEQKEQEITALNRQLQEQTEPYQDTDMEISSEEVDHEDIDMDTYRQNDAQTAVDVTSTSDNRVVEARSALVQRLSRMKKDCLANIAKQLCLRYNNNLNKSELTQNILATPQPAVKYKCYELQAMYLERTGRRLRDSTKAKMVIVMAREFPGFVARKRQAMYGMEWMSYVASVIEFLDNNASMVDTNFNFKWWSLKADIGKMDEMDDHKKMALLQDWQLLKLMPQFAFVVSQEEKDNIERQVNVLVN